MLWTVMVITILSGPMDGSQMNLLYKSEADCLAATSIISKTLHDSYDHSLDCVVSETEYVK